jgi:serine/threonine protein kinase
MSRDFLSLASELSMLDPALVEPLTAEAARTGEALELLLSRRGLLSPVQLDIIQTLLRPGEIVPGYELLNVLGHGGMGVVYRARQKTLDRAVAIKTILVSQMANRSMVSRFEQEARAVARLQHPHIIAAIDFGQRDGRLFFVMELVEGEDLESLIERRRLDQPYDVTERFAWGIVRQAAAGLAHAAEQGIVHRDIKPANLLLVEPPAGFSLPSGVPLVKIADFGLAFLATSEADASTRLTAANTTVGSPHYIAPEQLRGSQVDARADIYSLGATAFHLLTGRPPYAGLPFTQILTQKLASDAVSVRSARPDVSDASNSLVAAMMSRSPDDRVATYSELLRRIDELLADVNRTTRDSPSARRVATVSLEVTQTIRPQTPVSAAESAFDRRWPRRRWLWLAVSLLLGGAAVWAWTLRGTPHAVVRPQLRPTPWSQPLFNGRSLQHWKVLGGGWIPANDDDGARILSGTGGVISCRLARGEGQSPNALQHFALSLAVRLHQATAVEVQFGIPAAGQKDGRRFVLRIEPNAAWLATRLTDQGDSVPQLATVALRPVSESQPRVLRVVRDATHWFAFVDEQLIGAVPLGRSSELTEFRLAAESGPAWFSDLEVTELAEPPRDRSQ